VIIKKKYVVAHGREARVVEIVNRNAYFIYAISLDTNRLLSIRYANTLENTEVMLATNGATLGSVIYYKGETIDVSKFSQERLIRCDRVMYGEKPVRCLTQNINVIMQHVLGDKDYSILNTFRANRNGNHFYLEEAEGYTETSHSYLEAFGSCVFMR
jgi:hypothetical protein